jgi:hypothetical protein
MLDSSEIIVIIISGIIGALIVLLTTYYTPKYGSISGIITTIPTNTLVSLLGIAINDNNYDELQKNIYTSLILSYCAFLYLIIFWIYLPSRIETYNYPIIKTCILGIGFYSLISVISYKFFIQNIEKLLSNKDFLILAMLSVFKYYYFSSIHKFLYKFKYENVVNNSISKQELIWRFIVSFVFISGIILIGKVNEILGIIMSCFPLLSLINSVVLWRQTNNSILISQLNSNILIGGTTIYVYVLSFGFFLEIFNLYINVIVSLGLSLVIYNYPIYITLKKNNKINITNEHNENNLELTITEV